MISHDWTNWDNLGLLRQLGLVGRSVRSRHSGA
jgi:hypothetical protein